MKRQPYKISKSYRMVNKNLSLIISRASEIRTARLETLALTMIIPAIGFWINARDPFFLNNRFPWLILAPFLISQRYGFLLGFSSASFLICLLTLSRYFHWADMPEYPVEQVVGLLLITLITAEFHDLWQQKIQGLHNKCHYLNLRMNEFSRTYHILKGSHSQLEQQAANYTKSMRASLSDLENKMRTLAKHEGETLKGSGDFILKLVSEYGSIQTASLYPVSEDQKLNLHPISCLGTPPPTWPNHPLVREAFKSGHVTSIRNLDEKIECEILAVIPLIDVYQKIWGMVIVNEMPMFALQENTLDLLSLLGGHIGDLVYRLTETKMQNMDAWVEFEYELRRTLINIRDSKINTAMVVSITSSTKAYDDLMSTYRMELRGLDKLLSYNDSRGRRIIINLLPLTDENGLWDFLHRLGLLRYMDCAAFTHYQEENASLSTNNEDITIYSWILNEADSAEEVFSKIEQLCQGAGSIDNKEEYPHVEISS